MAAKRTSPTFIRNVVFGVEDSLVSTVGLLSGIAAADVPRSTIFLTGVVLIVVEAISMGIGSLLSEASVEELGFNKGPKTAVGGGLLMFISYFLSGFVPLFPYMVLEKELAFPTSIGASVIALLALGWWSGGFGNVSPMKTALRMALLGGIAIAAGVMVGSLLH